MRVTLSLSMLLVLLLPNYAAAEKILFIEFLNSNLTFGLVNVDHGGYDFDVIAFYDDTPLDWEASDGDFEAFSGPLVEQTLIRNSTGTVIASEYLYSGGIFDAQFDLERGHELISGRFVAPIITLRIFAREGFEGDVDVFYTLGPGVFDDSLAGALGIRPRTRGTLGEAYLFLTDSGNRPGTGGDYTSAERQAWDGVTWLDIQVPEPPLWMLAMTGAVFAFRKHLLHRRSVR